MRFMYPKNNLNSTNAQEAAVRAQSSNSAALEARNARDQSNHLFSILKEWASIFMNSPLWILTILFMLSAKMEIIFSWPMYQDLMSQMFGHANSFASLIGAGFIIAWGAYVSHLIAKAMSQAVFQYTVYNHLKFSDYSIPYAVAEEKARVERRKDLIKGIILGAILLFVVAAISWQRVWLVSVVTGDDYSLTHRILPVIAVLIEIFSGIYIGYLIRRWMTLRKAKKLHRRFSDQKEFCAYQTNMANDHYQIAREQNEKIQYSKDLNDCLYRFENRSQDRDDYVDAVPVSKKLKVVVTDENGLKAGVHLAGVLANGEYCNSVFTNEMGEGVLTWDSDTKEVLVVFTDKFQHKGPFRENATIILEFKAPKQIESV